MDRCFKARALEIPQRPRHQSCWRSAEAETIGPSPCHTAQGPERSPAYVRGGYPKRSATGERAFPMMPAPAIPGASKSASMSHGSKRTTAFPPAKEHGMPSGPPGTPSGRPGVQLNWIGVGTWSRRRVAPQLETPNDRDSEATVRRLPRPGTRLVAARRPVPPGPRPHRRFPELLSPKPGTPRPSDPNRKITCLSCGAAAFGGAQRSRISGHRQAAGARVTAYPRASSWRTWPRA